MLFHTPLKVPMANKKYWRFMWLFVRKRGKRLTAIQRKLKPKPVVTPGFPASRSLHKTCMNVAILAHAFVGGSRTVITPKNAVVIVTNISFRITGKRCAVFTICCAWPIYSMRSLSPPHAWLNSFEKWGFASSSLSLKKRSPAPGLARNG